MRSSQLADSGNWRTNLAAAFLMELLFLVEGTA